ncbi:MAG: type II toxin-antitoxin system Phd/YefM family antitoxin, partial [Chloroflexota bacterium]|nr:type II toxin-antitoxin system Phd/YefM family antitoxin [Chloroflexota bacterium]
MHIPQLMPISTMQRNYSAVVRNLLTGPVILSQYSKPVAVMLSPDDYERLASAEVEMKRLQRMIRSDQEFA